MNLRNARVVCSRCGRPERVCWCADLPQLPTRTRILMVQHPREEDVAIGTARMAHLCLPGSLLRVGLDFSRDPVVGEFLRSERPTHLLYPSGDARDVRELPSDQPINLVLVDGTWSQSRTLLRLNPELAALPRVAFLPRAPSEYRIRREPADSYVSTIEALAEVLTVLEGRPFDGLLDPFRLMVDHQVRFAREVHSARHKKQPRAPRDPRESLAERLRAERSRILCVHGDANGWPIGHPDRQPAELLHLVAHRPPTGERYEAILAARRPMAPDTPAHIGLSRAQLTDGASVEACRASWNAFRRPDDVLVHWGSFPLMLVAAEQLALPRRRFDLRGELAQISLRDKGTTLEDCARILGAPVADDRRDGRAGSRLRALVAILETLL